MKFKVDEESDSDGLLSDGDRSYDSSSSDSELEVTGGYYTKEMFLKKCVIISSVMSLIMSSLPLFNPSLCHHYPCFVPNCVVITPILFCYVMSFIVAPTMCCYVSCVITAGHAVMSLIVSPLPLGIL